MRPHAERLVNTDASRCFEWGALWRSWRGRKNATAASLCQRNVSVIGGPPYEDVFLGRALSQADAAVRFVDLSPAYFHDAGGFKARPSTLLWHGRNDADFRRRSLALHAWKGTQHCDAQPQMRCSKRRHSKSCAGLPLTYCEVWSATPPGSPERCSFELVDLGRELGKREHRG